MKISAPRGTQDFLPGAAVPRRFVIDRLARLFERYGFEPLETPAFENLSTLLGKYGEEGDRLIFKILKRGEGASSGEADLALRYDLTVPLARVVASYPDLPRPFKRYQIAPVWRAEKPQKGRYREFTQCDVDVVGSASLLVEVDVLSLAHEVYQDLGFTDFILHINHRQVLSGLIRTAGIPQELEIPVLVVMDKLDKVGPEAVQREWAERGLTEAQIRSLVENILNTSTQGETGPGSNLAWLDRLGEGLKGDPQGQSALADLKYILEGLEASGVPSHKVRIQPTLARGLGYYTGAIYEATVDGFSSSIGGGGRYDNLIGMFSGRSVPACGISFGLDRILLLLQERGLLTSGSGHAQVLVPVWDAATAPESLALAAELRRGGLRVDVFPEPGRLGPQLQYGTARGMACAAILGPEELARGQVAVRDLHTRQQTLVHRPEVLAFIHSALAGRSPVGGD